MSTGLEDVSVHGMFLLYISNTPNYFHRDVLDNLNLPSKPADMQLSNRWKHVAQLLKHSFILSSSYRQLYFSDNSPVVQAATVFSK